MRSTGKNQDPIKLNLWSHLFGKVFNFTKEYMGEFNYFENMTPYTFDTKYTWFIF